MTTFRTLRIHVHTILNLPIDEFSRDTFKTIPPKCKQRKSHYSFCLHPSWFFGANLHGKEGFQKHLPSKHLITCSLHLVSKDWKHFAPFRNGTQKQMYAKMKCMGKLAQNFCVPMLFASCAFSAKLWRMTNNTNTWKTKTSFKRSQGSLMVLLDHTRCSGQMGTAYKAMKNAFGGENTTTSGFATDDIIASNVCQAELHWASPNPFIQGKPSFRSSIKNGSESCPCSFSNIWTGIEMIKKSSLM